MGGIGRRQHGLMKRAVEAAHHIRPLHLPLFHLVQLAFHSGGKMHIHNIRKGIKHKIHYAEAQLGGLEILFVPLDVFAVQNGGDNACKGGGASYALVLQLLYKAGLVVTRRGLGEVLCRLKSVKNGRLSLVQHRQSAFILGDLIFLLEVI